MLRFVVERENFIFLTISQFFDVHLMSLWKESETGGKLDCDFSSRIKNRFLCSGFFYDFVLVLSLFKMIITSKTNKTLSLYDSINVCLLALQTSLMVFIKYQFNPTPFTDLWKMSVNIFPIKLKTIFIVNTNKNHLLIVHNCFVVKCTMETTSNSNSIDDLMLFEYLLPLTLFRLHHYYPTLHLSLHLFIIGYLECEQSFPSAIENEWHRWARQKRGESENKNK